MLRAYIEDPCTFEAQISWDTKLLMISQLFIRVLKEEKYKK